MERHEYGNKEKAKRQGKGKKKERKKGRKTMAEPSFALPWPVSHCSGYWTWVGGIRMVMMISMII